MLAVPFSYHVLRNVVMGLISLESHLELRVLNKTNRTWKTIWRRNCLGYFYYRNSVWGDHFYWPNVSFTQAQWIRLNSPNTINISSSWIKGCMRVASPSWDIFDFYGIASVVLPMNYNWLKAFIFWRKLLSRQNMTTVLLTAMPLCFIFKCKLFSLKI